MKISSYMSEPRPRCEWVDVPCDLVRYGWAMTDTHCTLFFDVRMSIGLPPHSALPQNSSAACLSFCSCALHVTATGNLVTSGTSGGAPCTVHSVSSLREKAKKHTSLLQKELTPDTASWSSPPSSTPSPTPSASPANK